MSSSPLNPHPQDAVAGHDAKSGVGALQRTAGFQPGEQHLIERGYVPVRQLTGKVVGVWGDAHIRHLDGTVTPLHVGDVVKKGEVVLTAQDGIVQLEGHPTTAFAGADPDVERIIAQVGNGDADAVPAAGPNSGGAAGSLEEGLRVDRDAESVTPASLAFDTVAAPVAAPEQQPVAPLQIPPVANPDSETTAANTPIVFDPRSNDSSSSALTITAVAGHAISPSTPVTLPQGVVSMNPDGSLTFTPTQGQSGTISFTYTETNAAGGSATSTVTVDVAAEPAPTAAIGLQHDAPNDTGASAIDSLTSNTHPVLDGSGQPDSNVQVTVTPAGGTPVVYNATTDASGHWTLDLSTATPVSGSLPAGGLPDGTVALGVSTTNDQGVTATATGSMTVDTTPPAASIDLRHDGANDTGPSSTDGLTANPHPVLVGTGEPNSTVTVTVTPNGGAPVTYAVATDGNGNWSVDTGTATPTSGSIPSTGLPDGPVALQVVSTDGAGNTTTATGSFTEDRTPPAASVDLKHDTPNDTGASSTDGVTANPHPVLVGTGEPNSTVTVTVTVTPTGGSPVTYSVPTDGNGNWSVDTGTATPTSGSIPSTGLPDGPVALQVVSTDGAGNTTTATGSFTEDHTPPAASVDLKHDAPNDTGASTTDGVTANPHPVLVGTGEPSSTVTVTVTPNGGTPVTYTAPTDANGNWSIDTSTATPTSGAIPSGGLPDGPVALQVISTDGAGNTTTATGSFTEDHTPPAASIDLKHDGADDTGASSTDGITANPHPVLVGTGEPNGSVTITVTPNGGAPVTYSVPTDANGNWSVDTNTATPTSGAIPAGGLPDGPVALQVVATDGAGNTTTATGSFTEDRTPPPATIDLKHDGADDTGASNTDGITANPHPVLVGTGEPSSIVTVTVMPNGGAPVTYSVPTDANGNWSVDTNTATPTSGAIPAAGLPDGPVALQVVSTDAAGNTSTGTGSFTEDHTPPAASIDLKHDAADDTGISSTDGITANPHPVLVGTGEPSSIVTVTVTPNGGAPITYSTPTDANGNWSVDTNTATPTSGAIPAGGLPDGPVALQVVSTDTAGNTTTAAGSFTEDHTAPSTPTIGLKHDGADDTGSSATDSITHNTAPVLVGTGDANTAVTITVTDSSGNKVTYDTTTDGSGNWAIDTKNAAPTSGSIGAGLAEGNVALTIVATDTAGNTSVPGTGAFVEDTTPPAATIDLKHDGVDDTGSSPTDGITSNVHPVITGTGEPSGIVSVTVTPNGGTPVTYTASTDVNGNWSIDLATAVPESGSLGAGLPDGTVGLQVSSTDAAGNTATGTGSFTVTHVPPAASIDLVHDHASDTGVSDTDGITRNAAPVIAGTGLANSVVHVTVTDSANNTLTYDAPTDAQGHWSIDISSAAPASGTLPAGGLANGQVSLSVVTQDVAGNTATATGAFTEDHAAQAATIGLKHDAIDDTGASSTDSITNNVTPVLSGTAEKNSTLVVTVTDSGNHTVTYAATSDANGNWSIDTATAIPTGAATPIGGLPGGAVTLTIDATDPAGNTASGSGSFTEVLTPVATIGLKHDAADDTGTSVNDSITNKTEPVITGSGPASTTLTVTATDASNNKLTYQVTTDASGNWSIDTSSAHPTSGTMPAAGFANGTVALGISGTDIAGNPVSASGSFQEVLAPVATIGLKHDAADDTGTSVNDSITNKTEPVITGTGPASTTLTVTATDASNNKLTYQVTTDAGGNWSIDTSSAHPTSGTMPAAGFANGTVTLGVTGTDIAGNPVTASGSFQEVLAPVATIGLKHDVADDTGTSVNDSITNKTEPVITGTGPVSTTLTVTATDASNNKLTYQVTTDAGGNWSIDTSSAHPTSGTMPAAGFANGTVTLGVTGTDIAGNPVTASGSFQEVLAPVATIGLKHDVADDTGTSVNDSITNKTEPVITGTGPASTTLTVTATDASNNKLTYQVTTDAGGNWSIDTSSAHPTSGTMPAAGFANGTVTLGVTGTDIAGNPVTASGSFQEVLAPTATVGLKHDRADDTGTSVNDSITNKTEPVITGTGPASTTLTVTATDASNNKLTYSVTTDSSGNWSIDTSSAHPTSGTMPAAGFANGTVTLGVTGTDIAGNPVTASGSFQEVLAPVATIGLKHDVADDTGTSVNDSITNKTEPVITGTGPASTTLTVTATDASNNKLTYQVTTDASGNWSIDTSSAHPTSGTMPATGFANGTVTLGVTGTDIAGNPVSASGSFQEVLSPTATIGLKHDPIDDTGTSSTDSITSKTEPVLTGTGPASTTLTVTASDSAGTKLTYSVTTDASGNWSIDTSSAHPTSGTMPASGFADGSVALTINGTDVAGNPVSGSGSFTEVLAGSATIGLKHDAADDTGTSINDSITNKTEPVITGTGPASTTLTVTATDASNNKLTYSVTTDASGNWSIDTSSAHPTSGTMPASGFANGSVALTVSGTDVAGNPVSGSGSFQEVLSPTATIGLKHDANDDTGTSVNDSITNKTEPVMTGTGPASTTLTVTATDASNNKLTYSVTTDAGGNWSIDTSSAHPTSGTMPAAGFANGTVTLGVTGTDIAGNPVTASGSFQEVLAPVATIGLKHDAADDTGTSINDSITNKIEPVITGTGPASTTLTVTATDASNNKLTYQVTTDASGNWSIDTSSAHPTSGTMPAAGFANGTVTLGVTGTDIAGNPVTASGSFQEVLAPVATIGLKHDAADDTGTSVNDSITNKTEPVITGTGPASTTLTVTATDASNNKLTYQVTTDAGGNWSIDTSSAHPTSGTMPAAGFANGTVTLGVTGTDIAGNPVTASGSFQEVLAPVATIGLKHDATDDTGTSINDSITNKTEPVIAGTGPASTTLTVTATDASNNKLTYSVTTDAGGNWSIDTSSAHPTSGTMPAAGFANGTVTLGVTGTDIAGNPVTASGSFQEVLAPVATIGLKHDATDDTGTSINDSITNKTEPVITGTGPASTTLTVTATDASNNKLTYSVTTDASGNWSIDTSSAHPTSGTMPAAGFANGTVTLGVTGTDIAGNPVTASGSFQEVLAPVATIGLKHDAADDTGTSINDSITNKTEPVITGTGPASTTLTVTATDASNNKLTYQVTTDASGNWSIDTSSAHPTSGTMPAAGFASGTVALGISGTDIAGNPVSASGSFQEVLAPVATISLKHDAADDTGTSSTDSITSKTEPVITGTGPASTTLTVTATDASNNKLTYQVTTDASGNWSIDTSSAHPTSGTMPASGFANGTVTLGVTGTDIAGNPVTASGSFQEVLAPVATIGLKHDVADDTGTFVNDSITNKTEPVITGTGPASTTLTVTATDASNNKLTYQVTTDAGGNWSIDTSSAHPTSGTMPAAGFANGTVTLGVTGTDIAGNPVTASGSFQEVLAPVATIGLKHDAADDTGTSINDSITNKTEPVLTGTGPASTTLTVTATDASNNKLTYQVTTDASGNWSIDTSSAHPTSGTMPAAGFANGTVTLGVTGTDIAGNPVTASGSFQEVLAPTATVGLKHDRADDTGTSVNDSITNKTEPVITGTGPASTTLTVTATDASNNKLTYSVTTDASGNWSIDTSSAHPTSGTMPAAGFANGTVTLGVTGTDIAGNPVTASGSFQEVLAPVATIGLKHDAADDTGTSINDSITNKTEPVITGTGPASTTLTVTATDASNNKLTYSVTTDASGNWSIDTSSAHPTSGTMPAAGFANGTVTLGVTGTDIAGNPVTASGSFQEVLAPVATIGLKHDVADDTGTSINDSITNKTEPVITGTGPASTTLTVTATDASNNKLTYSVTTDASGNWSIDTNSAHPTSGTMPAAGFANGTVTLGVTGTDIAGNHVSASGSFQEVQPTVAATIDLKHDRTDDTGTSSTDGLTNNVKPVLTGTGLVSSTITVTAKDASGHTVQFSTTTDASGNWSIDTQTATPINGTTMPGFSNGIVALTVLSADIAGNSASATGAFTEDLIAPVAAISLKHDATNDTGVSSTDSLTSNAEPVLVGTGEKNGTVQVTVVDANKDTLTYSATTDANGNWSIDTAAQAPTTGTMPRDGLSNGLVNLSVTSVDAAGNSATATNTFTIDIGNHAADPTVNVNAIGRWVFNEGSGTTTTDAYNANTGTLTNLVTANGGTAPTWVAGHNSSSGTALSFDGKGGVVSVPLADTAVLNTTSTLSVWFQTTQVGSTVGWSSPSIIGSEHQGDANDIQWGSINNLGEIGLGLGNDPTGVYSKTAVNDGKWHDLTITRSVNADGSSLVSVYVDGVLSNSATLAAQSPASNGIPTNFLAGFGYTNAWQTTGTGASAVNSDGTMGDVYYKGSLDDAAIYSHALTADQAKAVYQVENGFEGQAVANVGDPIKLTVTDTHATALHVIGVENGMTLTDGTHTINSTGNSQVIDITGWNLNTLQLTNVGTGSATLEFDAVNTNANGQTEDTSTYLSVVNGTSLLSGTAGNDTLNASANTTATFISGGAGNDVITGGSGNDHLIGGSGKDTISGGAGNDLIDPGSGSATLTGGAGNDVFHWELADHGTAGAPSVVTITDFSSVTGNKDMLDLRDLLPGANHDGTQAGNIADYLHFDLSGGDTVIHVSTTGGFASGYSAAAENETIVLKGVDLTAASSQTDSQIIHQLLANGQLHLG